MPTEVMDPATDEVTQLHRVNPVMEKVDGATLKTIVLGSDWRECDLESACPMPPPDGLMFRPEWRNVLNKNKVAVSRLFLVPVIPERAAPKPGAVDLSAKSDKELRVYCAEKDIVLPAETKEKPLTRMQILDAIAKGKPTK